MKKLLFAFLLLPAFCLAQYDSTKVKQPVNGYGFVWKNGELTSSFVIPRDLPLLAVKDSGALGYKDGKLWVFDGHSWASQLSTTSVDTSVYNLYYSILTYLGDTSFTNQFQPNSGVLLDTLTVNTITDPDLGVIAIFHHLYTNGNSVDDTIPLQGIINRVTHDKDSIAGKDSTFHRTVESDNGTFYVTVEYNLVGPNDTVTYHVPNYSTAGTGGISKLGVSPWGLIKTNDSTYRADSSQVTSAYANSLKLNKSDSTAGGYYPYSSNPLGYITHTTTDTLSVFNIDTLYIKGKFDIPLPSGNLIVGNSSNRGQARSITGDWTMSNTGVATNTGLRGASIPSLSAGFLKYTGSAWAFDNSTYLTANQAITVTATGDATGTSTSSATAPSLPLTLATVNSNIGSFGSASKTVTATVNAKGLATAISEQNISITESQVTSLVADLSGKGRVDSIRFVGTGLLTGSPAPFSLSGNTAIITPALNNQTAYTILGNNTSSSATPTFFTNIFPDSIRRVGVQWSYLKNGAWINFATDSIGGGSSAWNLTGNSGTTVGTNYLGTTDSVNLEFKANGGRAGYIGLGATSSTNGVNTAFGQRALENNILTTHGNTALGWNAMRYNSSHFSTAVGAEALEVNTGLNNVAVGYKALFSNTGGQQNTAVGFNALLANTSSVDNTAVGANALAAQVGSGGSSTAVGSSALAANTNIQNTAVGKLALGQNTGGQQNTAVGFNSMGASGSGSFNTAVGRQSSLSLSSGGNNISLGFFAGGYVTSQSGEVYINSYDRATYAREKTEAVLYAVESSNNMLGQSATLNGKVGINQISPTAFLQLSRGSLVGNTAPLKFTTTPATPITTTAATGNGVTATLSFTATTAPVFLNGTQITVAGVTPAGYNGTFTVSSATTTSVSFLNATTGAQTVAGTIAQTADLMTTPETGAMEVDSTNLYYSSGTGGNLRRYTVSKALVNTAALDFANTNAGASTDLTITVTGAADGDVVEIGVPNASTLSNGVFTAWVSAANTVTVRFTNTNLVSALDPASGTFRAAVIKY